MAVLKVKLREHIILDNQDYGSETVLEISGINEVVKRTVSVTTTGRGLLGFGTAISTNLSKSYMAGFFDEDNVRYIRITNLDSGNHILLTCKNESNDEFRMLIDAGHSFIYPCDNSGGVVDTMDALRSAISTITLADLVDIDATANTASCNVEIFVASV
jgi:hypothetical protein